LRGESGELLSIRLTAGNVDDQQPVEKLVQEFFGDKGYISRGPFKRLLCNHEQPLQLVTKLK
jgi:hypothetical protein